MQNEALTRHNNHSRDSQSTIGEALFEPSSRFDAPMQNAVEIAIKCMSDVETYVQAGIAPATRRAYRSDIEHFRAWGGDIPTTDRQLAAYLAENATVLKVATLVRRIAAISVAHEAQALLNRKHPTKTAFRISA